jgi:uncharacterized protein
MKEIRTMQKLLILAIISLAGVVLSAVETKVQPANNADIYFENLLIGDFDACYEMSSDKMQEALPVDKLRETWEGIAFQTGGYVGLIRKDVEEKETHQVHIYALEFSLMVLDMKVTLDDNGVITGLFFTPSSVAKPGSESKMPGYLAPENTDARDVEFDCEGFMVRARLTLPSKAGKFPLVLMLTGSGPNDMDETVGARKPFRDIADGLAGRGIATLRWNKRTRDFPEVMKDKNTFTVRDEYLPEVISALNWLKENRELPIDRYFILGHSMGGFILPMVADEVKEISGYIMMAGNARPLEDLVVEQYRYILGQDGMTPEEQEELDKIIVQAQAVKQLDEEKPTPDDLLLGVSKAYWLSLNYYNQTEVFRQQDIPFLILQGEKDYQVSMADFKLWQDAAKGKKQAILKSYPGLDHLFMQTEGDSTPQSYMTPAFVAEQVIADIADWVTGTGRN